MVLRTTFTSSIFKSLIWVGWIWNLECGSQEFGDERDGGVVEARGAVWWQARGGSRWFDGGGRWRFNHVHKFFNGDRDGANVSVAEDAVVVAEFERVAQVSGYFHICRSESLGLPYLSAYLDSVGSNFTHGANFATSGSTIRPQNTSLYGGFSPISLDVQLHQYNDFQHGSQIFRSQGGVFEGLLPKGEDFSRALYTFDIGQNDLWAGYLLDMTMDQIKAYVPDVLEQFKTTIKDIYGHGGKSYWIHNTGPIGCLPYVLNSLLPRGDQVGKFGCASPFNEVAQYFNRKLEEVVVQLRKYLPLAAITCVDVYSVKYELISQAKKHGFEHPLRASCGHGGKYNYKKHMECGTKITVNGKQVLVAKSCKDPSVAISWDGVHFTEAANKWVFDQIVDGSLSDPPNPLKMARRRRHNH